MFKKPTIWIVFILISIMGAVFSFHYYPTVFPIISIDLTMEREDALKAARGIAKKHGLGPMGFKQAASFGTDTNVQYYIELEAGGSEAFQKMIKENLYSPYVWTVRHFKEGQVNECEIYFTPDGRPYGFTEWLSENAPGAGLNQEKALAIAENEAKNVWNIDLSAYKLIEKSQEARPDGRIDHTFVYERPLLKIGEGRYRLKLEVSGDKLTQLYHFIKIPEEFFLRYNEMRSANDTIADTASYLMYSIYVLAGCCLGLFYLLRKRWLIWKTPLFWGLFIALLRVLAAVNQWPGEWMQYDTALSAQVFISEKVVDLIRTFIIYGFLYTLSIMAAESLTRKAFPDHIQLWRSASSGVAGSIQILGRTVGGYLLVALDLAFIVGLYFFSKNALGWWTPSDVLFDPDILATYHPWFSPVADSFRAGFWEESLCRAVPIAGAALIGQKLGHRRSWIIGALLFQAVLFGALHANYAGQPCYARLVELIIPSLVYGLIYLRFGLLTCIITHFAYDAVLMSIPIFASSAPGIGVDKFFVIILVGLPLLIIFFRRLKSRKWCELGQAHYNKTWLPAFKESSQTCRSELPNTQFIKPKAVRWILAGGALGLILWVFATNFKDNAPAILVDRSQAQALAEKALHDRNIYLQKTWKVLSSVITPGSRDEIYVWQEKGKNIYQRLLGNYLDPPLWEVRFAGFKGNIEERAEQYFVYISNDGKVRRIVHKLPESKTGADLNQEQARNIAYSALGSEYHLDPAVLDEISADSSKFPSRRDWTFVFSNQKNGLLKRGETRIAIKIAGDEVVDSSRYVHVPEFWSRRYQNREKLTEIIDESGSNLMLALILMLIVVAVLSWNRKNFSFRSFRVMFYVLSGISMVFLANNWPGMLANFSTAEPFLNQLITEATCFLFIIIVYPLTFSLFAGWIQGRKLSQSGISNFKAVLVAAALGCTFMGLSSLPAKLAPMPGPVYADYTAVDSYLPVLGGCLWTLKSFIVKTLIFLLLFLSIDKLSKGWTVRKHLIAAGTIIFWLAYTSVSDNSISLWLLSGCLTGVLLVFFYVHVFRFDYAIVPLFSATVVMLDMLKEGFYNAYPSAMAVSTVAIILTGLFAYVWFRKLSIAN